MNRHHSTSETPRLRLAVVALLAAGSSAPALAQDVHFGGYVRTWASFNLQNPPETTENDRYDLSMLRATALLDADATFGSAKLKAVGRLDGEYKTKYLKRLDDLPGQSGKLISEYNKAELREFYADIPAGDRVSFRLGKQQLVWGETDFFRAMDVVHGFDYSWRSFLEVENEELRKPLVLANMRIKVPEANGTLQAFIRPGWDRGKDIGNTYDLFGGRWANQPNKGFNFFGPSAVPGVNLTEYDYDHPAGKKDDVTGGLRWTGSAGNVNYSFAYLKTFNNDPVVNPNAGTFDFIVCGAATAGCGGSTSYQKAPKAALGDFIYPKVDVFGFTANGYSSTLDAVLSTEIAVTRDAAFNVGSNFLFGNLPGFGGVIRKNTLVTMFRADKQINLAGLIGTSRPSFASLQLFNTRVLSYKESDDIVYLAGFGMKRKQDSALLTMILAMNYDNDRINPTIAAGWDVTYGGGFFIPSVEFALGDAWRLRTEADLFFNRGRNKQPGQVESRTGLMGYFANNNQLVMRLTRQF